MPASGLGGNKGVSARGKGLAEEAIREPGRAGVIIIKYPARQTGISCSVCCCCCFYCWVLSSVFLVTEVKVILLRRESVHFRQD